MENKQKKEVVIPEHRPILRQKEAVKFLNVSLPVLLEFENRGLIKIHEIKMSEMSQRPVIFYLKDELIEAVRGL